MLSLQDSSAVRRPPAARLSTVVLASCLALLVGCGVFAWRARLFAAY